MPVLNPSLDSRTCRKRAPGLHFHEELNVTKYNAKQKKIIDGTMSHTIAKLLHLSDSRQGCV